MSKKIYIPIIILIVVIISFITINNLKKETKEDNNKSNNQEFIDKEDNNMNYNLKITVNNEELILDLANNEATKELISKLKEQDIVVNASEYDNFEKVGSLGFSLPTSDKYLKTEPGDLMLYQGNQITLFYNSNSWNYTKLGKVTNKNNEELTRILGKDDVVMTLSLIENN